MISDRRAQAFQYFVSMGWTPEQSAGLVANLEAESGLRPDAVGDGSKAYGLAQWHGDRQQGFASLMGKPIQGSSFEDQLAWVHAELQGSEKPAGDALRGCTTAAEAGACVSMKYERPADKQGEADKRAALATKILAALLPVASSFQIDAGGAQTAPDIPTPKPKPKPETPQRPDLPPSRPFNPEQESPIMGPLMFLPAILQMVPALIGIFGKGGERAQQNAALAQIAVDTFTKAIPQAVNTQQAVEIAQANPVAREAAAKAVMAQPDIVDMLNRLGPTYDRLHKIDMEQRQADVAGRDAAAERSLKDRWDMTRALVLSSEGLAWAIVLGGMGGVIAAAANGKSELALALLGVVGTIVGTVLKNRSQAYDYRFDGTPTSNAAAAMNAGLGKLTKEV